MALMSPTLDPSQQDQYRQRMQPMDQPSVASPGGYSPQRFTSAPMTPGGGLGGTYASAPRTTVSPYANTSQLRLGGTYASAPQFAPTLSPTQRGIAAGRVTGGDFLNGPQTPIYTGQPSPAIPPTWSASGIGFNGQAVSERGLAGQTHTGAPILPAQSPTEMAAGQQALQARHAILSPGGPTSVFDYQNQQAAGARQDQIAGAVATGAENQAANIKAMQAELDHYHKADANAKMADVKGQWDATKAQIGADASVKRNNATTQAAMDRTTATNASREKIAGNKSATPPKDLEDVRTFERFHELRKDTNNADKSSADLAKQARDEIAAFKDSKSPAPQPSESNAAPASPAVPAAALPASLPPAQHGTIKVIGGHTYRANEQTRQWEPATQPVTQ